MRLLTADTIIKVKQPLPLPRQRELTGETIIRLNQVKDLKEWVEDKHSNYKIGETAQWKDGLHQKTAHGWIKVPGQKDGYKGVKALTQILKTKEPFNVRNHNLGEIRVAWNENGHGLRHIIQRRFDEQFKKGKGETDTSKIKRNIACSLYAILDTIQNGTKVTPQKDKNSWQIHKNGFTAIIKRENGKYLFTGFYDHRTEKQAAETIKAVNAKYGYTPGFLDMYDQVGAALTSMGKFNS